MAVPALGGREKVLAGRGEAAPPQSSESAAEGETGDGDAGSARAAKEAAAIGCAETLAAKPTDSAPKAAPI